MRLSEIADPVRPNRDFEDPFFVTYREPRIVYHTTNESAADLIRRDGFRTGHDLGVNERRFAVYFADADVNPDLYARNREGDRYHGQAAVQIPADIQGLVLLNMTYRENGEFINHRKYKTLVVNGHLDQLPHRVDGTISYLEDGRIYEVALPASVANRVLQP